MKTIKVNLVPLCVECHRGTKGAHRNKRVDLRLKELLQHRLNQLFRYKKFYNQLEIQELLQCNEKEVEAIVKKMCLYIPLHQKELMGYEKEQLIRRLLGGRLY